MKINNIEEFEKIVKKYENELLIIAEMRIGKTGYAKDVVQETFISLFINYKRIKKEKIKPWLTRVLINKCNDLYRKDKINVISYEDNNIDNYIQTNEETKSILDDISFEDIIKTLDTDERTIIGLYYKSEYTIKEISIILKMNENTVKTKLYRAKEKLKIKVGGK